MTITLIQTPLNVDQRTGLNPDLPVLELAPPVHNAQEIYDTILTQAQKSQTAMTILRRPQEWDENLGILIVDDDGSSGGKKIQSIHLTPDRLRHHPHLSQFTAGIFIFNMNDDEEGEEMGNRSSFLIRRWKMPLFIRFMHEIQNACSKDAPNTGVDNDRKTTDVSYSTYTIDTLSDSADLSSSSTVQDDVILSFEIQVPHDNNGCDDDEGLSSVDDWEEEKRDESSLFGTECTQSC